MAKSGGFKAVALCRFGKYPDDNPVLSMALEADADFLVSGDKRDFLSIQHIGSTPIISAVYFLQRLMR